MAAKVIKSRERSERMRDVRGSHLKNAAIERYPQIGMIIGIDTINELKSYFSQVPNIFPGQ